MSLTTLIFLALYFTGLFLTFRHPYYGIATYIFEWHNHPPYMWWGRGLPDLRWSLLVALVTLISLVINYKKLKQLRSPDYAWIFWLVAMTLWMFVVSLLFAVDPAESFKKVDIFFKMTVQIFLMMFLVRTVEHHRFVIWTMMFGVANFGRTAYQRGSNRDLGVTAPNATEENAISAHVAAITGFFGLYFLMGKKWEKIVTFLSLPFLVNLVILANSRASFLAMMIIGLLALLWLKGRMRYRAILGVVLGGVLVLMLGNEQFWARQNTITEYEEEGSAMSRFYLWNGALKMFQDHPMGLGGDGFQAMAMQYVPELVEVMEKRGVKTVHNTFLLVLVEWGFIGTFIFFGMIIHALVIMGRIRRDAKHTPHYRFYIDAVAMQMGIIGILAAGLFHNRLYSEVVYWFAAFSVALRNIQVDYILTPEQESSV